MSSESPVPVRVGPYRVEGRLGKGGMGEVLRGHDDRLDRPVALKRIRPDARDPEKALKRFRREARALAKLSHPAIVQVYDWEESEGEHWLVMELVEGQLLADLLAGGPLPAERAVAVAREVASGLATAHEAGLVHRDLKAGNVIVMANGQVKILDFGLAKVVEDDEMGSAGLGTTLTGERQVVGTVSAMSPEQALGRPVDHRSDLFSLGIFLYEMLSGASPFKGDSATETLTRICTLKEQPLHRLDPEIPEGLSRLVEHLLEKEPARRPPDARQVIAKLDRLTGEAAEGSVSDVGEESSLYQGTTLFEGSSGVRRTVVRTLLLSDLVDSTRLVEQLGDERASVLFERHDRLARRLLAQHEGREVDKSDGFLFLFIRPMAAVRYALDYHAALAAMVEREGVELRSRVGIHVGEVVVRENGPGDVVRGAKPLEVEGLTKSMAARFMSLARGGQTLVSRGVYDMARRAAVGAEGLPEGLSWVAHGRYRMKGVEEPVGVFEVGVEGMAPLLAPVDSQKAERVVEDRSVTRSPRASRRWLSLAAAGVPVLLGLWSLKLWLRSTGEEAPAVNGASPAARSQAEETQPFETDYEKGLALLERFDQVGNLDQAIEVFESLVERHPDSAAAHAGLAQALWRKHWIDLDNRWLEEARPMAKRAVELDPYLASGQVSLGLVSMESGELDVASEAFDSALRLNPASALVHSGLGQLYEARGELDNAELAYRRALEIRPQAWDLQIQLGTLYFQQSRFDEAEEAYELSLAEAPGNVYGVAGLSGVYFMQGRYAEAAAELQKAIAIRPHAMLYTNLGNIFFYQGLYEQAIAPFQHAVELEEGASDPLMWGNLGDALRWTPGHEEEARAAYLQGIALLREHLATRPGDTEVTSRLALYLARSGACKEALATAAKPESSAEIDASSWFRLALTYEQCDQRPQALTALGEALSAGYSLVAVEREQELDRLRTDPGFLRLRATHSD